MWLLKLFSLLPFSVLYAFSNFLFFISYHVVKYRRKMVAKNLLNSFPDKSKEALAAIEKQFYKNLCDYAVETLKLISIKKSSLTKRMVFTNPDMMAQFTEKKQSVLLLSSHHFNWEWLLVAGSFALPAPIDFVYQPVQSKLFNDITLKARSRFGAFAIKRNEIARELIKRKGICRGIAIVADQYPGHENDKRYLTNFLHQETAFFYGSQQMAELTGYPVLYAVLEKVKRGYYTCTLKVVGNPPYQKGEEAVIENYAKAVEACIVSEPSNWLWSHNRWKTRHLENKN